MRTLRSILILLLCLAFPAYGYASLGVVQLPCPMQSDTVDMDMSHAKGDCCLDADTAAKTGKTCKTGHECSKVGGLYQLAPTQAAFLLESGSQVVSADFLLRIASDPTGVWHPPRIL